MNISGGTMLGYCAMGSPSIATTPTITMMIEMTMATMGRLMKNFDTATYPFPGRGCPRARWALLLRRYVRGVGFRVDDESVLDLLDALGDDALAGLQTFLDY